MPQVIVSLNNFCKGTKDLNAAILDDDTEGLISEMLALLADVAYHTEMYPIFSKCKKEIIKHTLFTLIRTT